MSKQPAVYILASKRNGTLYVGVTSNLRQRAWTHKTDLMEGFTKKYGVHSEKQIKKWNRAWKLELIEAQNPDWKDLWDNIL